MAAVLAITGRCLEDTSTAGATGAPIPTKGKGMAECREKIEAGGAAAIAEGIGRSSGSGLAPDSDLDLGRGSGLASGLSGLSNRETFDGTSSI